MIRELILFSTLGLFAYFVCRVFLRIRGPSMPKFSDGTSIPLAPGGDFLLGHVKYFAGNGRITSVIEKWAEHAPVFYIRLGVGRMILSADPELNRQVLLRRPSGFSRPRMVNTAIQSMSPGDGLFNAEGETWKLQRKLTAPAFTKRLVEQRASVVDEHIRLMLDGWEKQSFVDASSKQSKQLDPLEGWPTAHGT
jgi:cytochrome P450